jgi:hypothetical protein
MCIGLYTHYAHCDQAYFAVRLVSLLRACGEAFDIYSDNSPGRLRLAYDNTVKHRSVVRYTDWAPRRRAIVWTHVPRVEQLNYAARRGIMTVVVPMWQDIVPPFKKALRRADRVIATSTECRDLLTDVYKLSNVSMLPFDTGLPISRKDTPVNSRRVRLFLPWFDRNARCSSSSFLGLLGHLIERTEEPHLTVAVNSSRFGPAVAKFFTRLGVRTGGRVTLVRNVPLIRRPSLYANADLTIWPGECDNYGLCGLTSLAAGTPVLSLALPPQTDYLLQGVNAALVKTKVEYDDIGVPHAIPNYERFVSALQDLIAEPWHISHMQKKVAYNLLARKAAFESGWRKLLDL